MCHITLRSFTLEIIAMKTNQETISGKKHFGGLKQFRKDEINSICSETQTRILWENT